MKIFISEPLWSFKGKYGSPSVGIAPYKLRGFGGELEVEVLFKDKEKRVYDGIFSMNTERARSYPKHDFRCGEMIVIPLDEFDFQNNKGEEKIKMEENSFNGTIITFDELKNQVKEGEVFLTPAEFAKKIKLLKKH